MQVASTPVFLGGKTFFNKNLGFAGGGGKSKKKRKWGGVMPEGQWHALGPNDKHSPEKEEVRAEYNRWFEYEQYLQYLEWKRENGVYEPDDYEEELAVRDFLGLGVDSGDEDAAEDEWAAEHDIYDGEGGSGFQQHVGRRRARNEKPLMNPASNVANRRGGGGKKKK
jgi:hypothetical protein